MNQKTLIYSDFRGAPSIIKTPRHTWWFTNGKRKIDHCIFSCGNSANVVYITPKGYAHLAYCDAHARSRIVEHMLEGSVEKGLWCTPENGKWKPHHFYERFIDRIDGDLAKKYKIKIINFLKKSNLSLDDLHLYYLSVFAKC